MVTEAQKKASAKYDKNHTKSIIVKLNKNNDADILAKLDEVENKQGYIKNLIREDICGCEPILSIDSLRLMILPVIQKFGIKKVSVFGSYARGEATENSDVDFLVESEGINEIKEYLSLKKALQSVTGKSVDVVMYEALNADETRAAKRLIEHINKEQVIIYDKTK